MIKLKITAFFLLLNFTVSNIAAAEDTFPLLEINKGSKKVWLIGSMHVGKNSVAPSQKLDLIIRNSKAICLESDPNKKKERRDIQRAAFFNPVGISLEQRIGSTLYKAVHQKLIATVTSEKSLERASPFAVHLLLLGASPRVTLATAGLSESKSLDSYIAEVARERNISIIAIESEDSVIDALSKISDEEWKKYVSGFLDMLSCSECVDAYARAVHEAYTNSPDPEYAHAKLTEALSFVPGATRIEEKILFGDRNIKIAENIDDQALGDGKCDVIAVGSAHLGGDNGLIKLLRARNLKVTIH